MPLGLRSGNVKLSAPDSAWVAMFAAERARLSAAVAPHPLAIEHIGSTAIPGIPAKPILDLLAGRGPTYDVTAYVTAFRAAGYEYRGEHGIPGRDYFVLDDAAGRRTHHLHLVEEGGSLWRSHLAFRDFLCARPERAAEYAALKLALAERYPADREAYTDGKTTFITAMLQLAAGARDE